MKLRYYLRGLGIGIIGTALIMQLTAGSTGNMTDEEVKKRAAELGMVEESATTLLKESEKRMEERKETESQKQISSNEVSKNEVSENKVSENEISENKISEEVSDNEVSANLASQNETPALPLGTVLDEAEDGQASGQKQQEKAEPKEQEQKEQEQKEPEKKEQEEPVTITISSGQGSLSVAKSCESAGLVTDAAEFDRFLCAGGYDRRLKAGSHQIKKGASKEEIAEALCKRN